jgi:hypothetical protein
MSEQIRSADFLVKSALSSPETIEALRTKPEETLRSLAKEATESLPQLLPEPDKSTNNAIWLIIVCAFVVAMLGSVYVLGAGVTSKLEATAIYVTKGETILTIFTTAVAFLAGLLSPSPLKK